MKKLKKLIACTAVSALCAGLWNIPVQAENNGNEDFDTFMTEQFKEIMESDYMTLHYGLRNYEVYGITKPEVNIGTISKDDYETDRQDALDTIKELEEFDYDSLSASQQHDYDTYKYYLENMALLNAYPDFDFAFLPSEGLINNLLTNFTEFKFYTREDVEDYLTVLESVPGYLDTALEITKEQAEKGFFMTDSALDETLDQIDKFVEVKDDNQLIVIFNENIDALDFLNDADKEMYKNANQDIVLNQYIPSYEKCGEELEKLRGSRKGDGGLYTMEGGEEYYKALIRLKASSDDEIEDLLDVCTNYIADAIDEYIEVYLSKDEEDAKGLDSLDMEDPIEVLNFLQENMKATYPAGPEVTYKASYLDPSVANGSIVAYYVNPPIDDIKDNIIKINGDNVGDTQELYTTLAHEGFPGHLYQITWYLNTNPNPLRTAISNIGYTEGWGMYSELEANAFSGLSKKVYIEASVNIGAAYAMNAAADLGVNGLGWTVDDLADYLDGLGLDSANAQPLFDFVTENPGTIVPYGYGIARFGIMRKEAEEKLGEKFDATEFHNVLLTYGDRPFDLVEKDLEAYYAEKGAAASVEAKDEKADQKQEETKPAATAKSGSSTGFIWILATVAVVVIALSIFRRKKRNQDTF